MNDMASRHPNSKVPPTLELNNNTSAVDNTLHALDNAYLRQRNVSLSSASSTNSDTSEEPDVTSPTDVKPAVSAEHDPDKVPDGRKYRSMSDGHADYPNEEPFEVYPSLPDSVLEKLGLLGAGHRDELTAEDLEQKFVALTLAFTIDSATIKDRCERQRRYRDQTETNMSTEINKLIEKVNRLHPLCVDAETAELLSGLLAQVDVVTRISTHATICAERFGAVQHEQRMAESVAVMINHVTILKQQRDAAKKQLQYTTKVLQNTNLPASENSKRIITPINSRMMTKRRASIATIIQPSDTTGTLGQTNNKRFLRRTSDLTTRISTISRTPRTSRLELSVDLDNINEANMESPSMNIPEDNFTVEDERKHSDPEETTSSLYTSQNINLDTKKLSLSHRVIMKAKRFGNIMEKNYYKWTDDGTLHEIFIFGALTCLTLGLIVLSNLLVEMEYAKRGINSISFNWPWTSFHAKSPPILGRPNPNSDIRS